MDGLVTGATGNVGSRFVPRLAQWAGPGSVRVLVRDAAKAAGLAALGVEVVTGDLREASDRAKALGWPARTPQDIMAWPDKIQTWQDLTNMAVSLTKRSGGKVKVAGRAGVLTLKFASDSFRKAG